jgi:antitoxin ParD1/3/4
VPRSLEALRDAAKAGIADIESGHFETFHSPEALAAHYEALAAEVLDVAE